MAFLVKGNKHHKRVVFQTRAMAEKQHLTVSSSSAKPAPNLGSKNQQSGFIIEELSQDDIESITDENCLPSLSQPAPIMSAATARAAMIPEVFKNLSPFRDLLNTQTSQAQDKTVQECLPFLSGESADFKYYNYHGLPHLDRKRHIAFLHKSLKKLPAPYVVADAARPWMFYWALSGLTTMGEDVSEYRKRLMNTVRPIQNESGGFGGGNGQMSHLAPTYAILLSLAIVGGDEALGLIDRKAMWKWLGRLKQPDGGFQMSVGGEEDVRGAYCAVVIISLLNLPLDLPRDSPAWTESVPTLLTNLPEWVARCQTFEGGITCKPDAEAHGGYAFCALACLCILGEPHVVIPKYLDVPRLVSWLSARQYSPEGGFAGRTNKLVDGCYSHWIGGCWPLVEACVKGPTMVSHHAKSTNLGSTDGSGDLYSREGLIRYILCCCQDVVKRGGLRDKPSHNSDSYHTCYVLAGLSSAQHKWNFNHLTAKGASGNLASPYHWNVEHVIRQPQIYDEEDRVETVHPVFVVPEGVAEATRAYFATTCAGWD
ncbi:CaaX farnesyltransferas-like protein beta subunit Ram1 [Calycina marina]|uniref:Protein farnesyltransferase subunit beta n=1 Tax=Calycina marina TaxID=1763456 RepID=A0A9P8CJ89_9HELO|nr:CaaX farnesyltransferas-like protein beta subunit Ram1 [Calycina marina]